MTRYTQRNGPRAALYLGSLGLAGLCPTGLLPSTAWVVATLVAPIALCELGAAIEEAGGSDGSRRLGARLQALGGAVYVALFGWYLSAAVPAQPRGLVWMTLLSALGLLPAAWAWIDLRRVQDGDMSAGRATWMSAAMDERRKAAAEQGGLRAVLAVVGLEHLLVIGICVAFVGAAVFIAVARPPDALPVAAICGLFFGGGFFVVLASALERWRVVRPSPGLAGLIRISWALGGVGMGLGACGLAWTRGDLGWLRWLFGGVGVLFALAGLLWGLRALSGRAARFRVTDGGLVEDRGSWEILYPWSAIAGATIGELAGNVCVFVSLEGSLDTAPFQLRRAPGLRARAEQKLLSGLRRDREWTGAALTIMPQMIDLPPIELVDAIEERRRDAAG